MLGAAWRGISGATALESQTINAPLLIVLNIQISGVVEHRRSCARFYPSSLQQQETGTDELKSRNTCELPQFSIVGHSTLPAASIRRRTGGRSCTMPCRFMRLKGIYALWQWNRSAPRHCSCRIGFDSSGIVHSW